MIMHLCYNCLCNWYWYTGFWFRDSSRYL